MSKNFSAPRSKPKPASVTVQSACAIAILVAMTELQPWAMLAKGPPWTSAGTPSTVCTRLGIIASRRSTIIEPTAWRSRAVTGCCRQSRPTSRSAQPAAQVLGVLGEAQDRHHLGGGGDVEAGLPRHALEPPPRPMTTCRRARSLRSTTRRHSTRRGSMPSWLPWCRWLSSIAASRLWAVEMAWKSPVKWRLMSSDRLHRGAAAAGGAALHAEGGAEARARAGPGRRSRRGGRAPGRGRWRWWSCPRRRRWG